MGPNKAVPVKYTQLFINNEFVNSVSGRTFSTYDPSTGEKIASIQEGGDADIDRAVGAARTAFRRGSPWRTADASERGRILRRWSDLIERDAEILSNLETRDMGAPYSSTRVMIGRAVDALRYYAAWSDKITGETLPADGSVFAYTRKEPRGVVGLITPWNVPMLIFAGKVAPALAAGCTVVVKPAEDTPLTALHMAALSIEAGFPPGVVNVVPGFGHTAGAALTAHRDVNKISFTGSTAVGKLILRTAGETNLKRVTLELGGKSPLVIFDDADLSVAVPTAQMCCFANSGQVCVAPSRCFVQSGIYDQFVAASRSLAGQRVVGDPFDPATQQGPQVNEKQFNHVLECIKSGVEEGARLECGGKPVPGSRGYFIQPTVFSGVKDEMRIATEEIFGPVQQIMKFDTMEEVLDRANNTQYGLAAGCFTQDLNRAIEFAHGVESGLVWVNHYMHLVGQMPFGGYKMSGLGREGGQNGIEEYFELKTVSIKLPSKNS